MRRLTGARGYHGYGDLVLQKWAVSAIFADNLILFIGILLTSVIYCVLYRILRALLKVGISIVFIRYRRIIECSFRLV